mmetsp:Transcript_12050/g.34537  ORF Transcript_12050/g.34537 Transcript_12050/m.34537 type:complete len:248 (-) Transcript_12050:173-916(-)
MNFGQFVFFFSNFFIQRFLHLFGVFFHFSQCTLVELTGLCQLGLEDLFLLRLDSIFCARKCCNGVVRRSLFQSLDKNFAVWRCCKFCEGKRNTTFTIRTVNRLRKGQQQQVHNLFTRTVAERQMKGEHSLVILLFRSFRENRKNGFDYFCRCFKHNSSMKREETPPDTSIFLSSADECTCLSGVTCGTYHSFLPQFLLYKSIQNCRILVELSLFRLVFVLLCFFGLRIIYRIFIFLFECLESSHTIH